MKILISLIIGYLIGSLNSSYILGKIKGIDIRTVNSHNPGAANAKLTFGWWAFIVVWLLDTLKAIVAFYLIKSIFPNPLYAKNFGTAFVVIGHCFPIFIGFKGGKGFSSVGGVLAAFSPVAYFIALLIGVLVGLFSNSLALLTLVTLIASPFILLVMGESSMAIIALILAVLFTIYRHLHNFNDLFAGKEPKIFETKPGVVDLILKLKSK